MLQKGNDSADGGTGAQQQYVVVINEVRSRVTANRLFFSDSIAVPRQPPHIPLLGRIAIKDSPAVRQRDKSFVLQLFEVAADCHARDMIARAQIKYRCAAHLRKIGEQMSASGFW